MSGFQIPGLGQAKPNETLPSESFAPDLLAAAASLIGVDGLGLNGANEAQWGKQEKKEEQKTNQEALAQAGQPSSIEGQSTKASDNAMEVDNPELPAAGEPTRAGLNAAVQSTDEEQDKAAGGVEKTEDTAMIDEPAAPGSPQHVAHALEAALDGLLSTTAEPTAESSAPAQDGGMDGVEGQQPEWEADSSPYESSSESDSSDSSSEDDSEDEGGYQLLGLEETARLLMAESGDGDGGAKGGKGVGGGQVRTKNEVPDEPLPKPDVVITEEMAIQPLGLVEFVVEKTVVIKSQTPGEVQALDTGSVLCRGDRTVIGVLADTIGNVRSPLYTVGFSTEEEIGELELQVGTEIFYSVDHAKYVFTQELKGIKGTDASNLHDEEVAADEMEFSDDEKEAEYKRQLKAKKRGNKAGRGGRDQSNQAHPLSNSNLPPPPNSSGPGLNYDEDEDGPYKPLSRPANFGQGLPPSLPQLPPKPELAFSSQRGGHGHRGSSRGGRGDFRGDFRGGRGRGGRGRERGGGDRRHDRGGYGGDRGGYGGQHSYGASSSPPNSYSTPRPAQSPHPPQPLQNPHLPPPPYGANPHPIPPPPPSQWPAAGSPFVPPPPVPHLYGQSQGQSQAPAAQTYNFNYQAWAQNQAHAYPYGQQGHPAPPPQQPPQAGYRAPAPAPAWPPVGAPAPPAGAYVNPAFFAGLQQGQVPQAPVPPPPQQPYWGQPHGGYGQGK
ncbi:NAF1-domain-containing protein [Coniochaeta ligniaria NRRL 30616]|uniref:H/ACA ribonucleoprotein complex non-core subunit NAF1 n=1 Tax=Coniochaeta ligniaria NRRL 30616 TaxID=1408157 RepID=A0A1J7JF01_9PEZI|nr:NAF1-domain-containing protein [Coniochaeta ligniaria NRRL 30616]